MNPIASFRRMQFGAVALVASGLAGKFLQACFGVVLVSAGLLGASLAAQPVATGAVAGRVQNEQSGIYLNKAQVTVRGTQTSAQTNAAGEYRLAGVPAGDAVLDVFFTGMAPYSVKVSISPDATLQQDIALRRSATVVRADGTLVLEKFVVASEREYDAAAIAINEQRFSANRKDVVSTDAFGEINQGNVGEFVKFLPGISLDVKDGNTPSGIMVRGFDPNYTNVTLDGGMLASTIIANTQTSSRQFVLDGANINNLARIEVVKLPTPDMSANLLGGAVNFVSRSAFERAKMETRLSVYLSANEKAMDIGKTPGPLAEDTSKILPSFDLQFVHPVNKRFGYVVTAAYSSQYYLQNRAVLGARFTSAGATLDNPYTTNFNTNFAPNRSDRTSGGVAFDFKAWDTSTFKLKLSGSGSKQQTASRGINYNVGGGQPVRWDRSNVLGSLTTAGSVGLGNSFQERHALSRSVSGAWNFTRGNWEVEAAGSFSNSNNRTRDGDKGFFRTVSVNLPNVRTVNLEGINQDQPSISKVTVLNAAGQRIDELKLANYNLTTAGMERLNATDEVMEARLNVIRKFSVFGQPMSLKTGGNVNDMTRDLSYTPVNYTYVGADGVASSGDEGMANFVSESDRGISPGFGIVAPEWPDSFKVWKNFVSTPRSWTQTSGQAGDVPRNVAIRSPWLREKISAAYIMGDLSLLKNRLRLVGGVRYEQTFTEGLGFRQDADAVLVKDANGNVLDTNPATAGVQSQIRPELLPNGSGAYNEVLYKRRGYYNSRDYDYYHPSVHGTFNLTKDLLIRAAYAETIGRPNLSDIVPNLFVGENLNFGVPGNTSATIPGFITGANLSLRPWTAKNYDYSIEYYLPKNGLLMFNYFKKDIRDFFSSVNRIADQALLDQLGVSSDALGYQYTQRINLSDARIDGWEARADLPLTTFTQWEPLSFANNVAKHFTFMVNLTHLQLTGSRITASDWKRYIPRGRNLGLRFSFSKVSGNLLLNWRGKMLRDTANQFPGANEYIRARNQLDGNVEYQVTKRFAVFFAGRNLTNEPTQWEVSGPGVPAWSTLTNHEDYGPQYSLGLRSSF